MRDIRQAVILAAGASSRFWPFGQTRHKSLYKIGVGRSPLEETVLNLIAHGITHIVVVCQRGQAATITDTLTPMIADGAHIKCVIQPQTSGQGNAILLASANLPDERFFLIGPDKVNAGDFVNRLRSAPEDAAAVLATQETDTPELYGIAECVGNTVVSVTEKPPNAPMGSRKITSVYVLSKRFVRELTNHTGEHYGLESVLDRFAQQGEVAHVPCDGIPSLSLKYPWHLLNMNQFLLGRLGEADSVISTSDIHRTALIEGPVILEEGVRIHAFANITGPCFVGRGTVIGDYARIRGGCFVGRGAVIGGYTELKSSILMDGTKTHANQILDSIIGSGCNIGAQTVTGNRRLDGGTIRSTVKDVRINTGERHFGAIIGSNVSIGTNVNLGPGIKIGSDSVIGPGTNVLRDIPEKTLYYVDQERGQIVEKSTRP